MVEVAPTMEVSGVRISCETERSRLARIFSFAFSRRRCSCCLVWDVRVLVMMETIKNDRKLSG